MFKLICQESVSWDYLNHLPFIFSNTRKSIKCVVGSPVMLSIQLKTLRNNASDEYIPISHSCYVYMLHFVNDII